MIGEHNLYKNKYFKYKKKYILLKKIIEGGTSNIPPPAPSAEEIGDLLIARVESIKDDGKFAESKDDIENEEKYEQFKAEENKKDGLAAEEMDSKNQQFKDKSNSKEDEIRAEVNTMIDIAEKESISTRKSFFDILAEKLLSSLPKETVRSKRMINRSRIIGEQIRKKNIDLSKLKD
jgi:hypothetical protein